MFYAYLACKIKQTLKVSRRFVYFYFFKNMKRAHNELYTSFEPNTIDLEKYDESNIEELKKERNFDEYCETALFCYDYTKDEISNITWEIRTGKNMSKNTIYINCYDPKTNISIFYSNSVPNTLENEIKITNRTIILNFKQQDITLKMLKISNTLFQFILTKYYIIKDKLKVIVPPYKITMQVFYSELFWFYYQADDDFYDNITDCGFESIWNNPSIFVKDRSITSEQKENYMPIQKSEVAIFIHNCLFPEEAFIKTSEELFYHQLAKYRSNKFAFY